MLLFFTAATAILLTVLRFIPRRGKWANSTAVLCVLFCLAGALCVGLALRDAAALKNNALPDAETAAWAYDMLSEGFSLLGVGSAVFGTPLLLASLIRHKLVWMRTVIAPCAVIVVLLSAGGYALLCDYAAVDMTDIILTFGAGCGALLLCGTAADAVRYAVSGQGELVLKRAGKSSAKSSRRGKKRR